MYLTEPKRVHEHAMQKYMVECDRCGVPREVVAGSHELANALFGNGFDVWVDKVKANATASEVDESINLAPGHTFLIIDEVVGPVGSYEEYVGNQPLVATGEVLVGTVTLRSVQDAGYSNLEEGAMLTVSLLPSMSNTASYMRAIQATLTYIVCAGLPYRHICFNEQCYKPDDALKEALQRCFFEKKSEGCPVSIVDLSATHQLKTRIRAWSDEEGR